MIMAVEFSREGHIAKVGLNIPETRNALGCATLQELYRIWEECRKDDAVRAVVFYSALDGIFCSGMDLRDVIPILTGVRAPETESEKWLFSGENAVARAMLKKRELDRPIIAAVHGYCLTGGFEMVMGCELRVASEDAVFQMRETTLGIMPTGGSNVFLPLQVGQTRALEILLTGNNFTAKTLYEWGFLNRLVPREKLMEEAMALAERIAGNGPRSVRAMVRCSREIVGKSLDEALDIEFRTGIPVFSSDDAREGIRAQKEKRKPNFQ
jgi:enoyl-CoA hydratase